MIRVGVSERKKKEDGIRVGKSLQTLRCASYVVDQVPDEKQRETPEGYKSRTERMVTPRVNLSQAARLNTKCLQLRVFWGSFELKEHEPFAFHESSNSERLPVPPGIDSVVRGETVSVFRRWGANLPMGSRDGGLRERYEEPPRPWVFSGENGTDRRGHHMYAIGPSGGVYVATNASEVFESRIKHTKRV
ncbi:hypothetical protein BDM02DRAFT_3129251 [Thelephora ganbajun]|uniref:Uncharacterized protein n=1 Tax=Thelephora ganbajun TaxID=370292 RepID=A0ACB6ZF32_THEGA|nr:hypothetical protein BDM02DRAFT_3129251 [Thelephora ganbajun]